MLRCVHGPCPHQLQPRVLAKRRLRARVCRASVLPEEPESEAWCTHGPLSPPSRQHAEHRARCSVFIPTECLEPSPPQAQWGPCSPEPLFQHAATLGRCAAAGGPASVPSHPRHEASTCPAQHVAPRKCPDTMLRKPTDGGEQTAGWPQPRSPDSDDDHQGRGPQNVIHSPRTHVAELVQSHPHRRPQ